jgi:hypothetical protein
MIATRLVAALALLVTLTPGSARAGAADPMLRLGDRDVSPPLFAFRYGVPLHWSGSASVVVGRLYDVDRAPCAKGMILGCEVGSGGGKLSMGKTIGPHLIGYYPHGVAVIGLAVKATVLRTWGHPLKARQRATFVGLEGEIGMFMLDISLGYGRCVAGPASSARDLLLLSGGLGF